MILIFKPCVNIRQKCLSRKDREGKPKSLGGGRRNKEVM